MSFEIAISTIGIVIMMLFAISSNKTPNKPLKKLFLFVSLFIMILVINTGTVMATAIEDIASNFEIVYQVVTWTVIFTFLYSIIMFIFTIFNKKKEDKKRETEEE